MVLPDIVQLIQAGMSLCLGSASIWMVLTDYIAYGLIFMYAFIIFNILVDMRKSKVQRQITE